MIKFDILSSPFQLPKKITIVESHTWVATNPGSKCPDFFFGNTEYPYYIEDLTKSIAYCGIGHIPDASEDEKLLFYNIVCHLFKYQKIKENIK